MSDIELYFSYVFNPKSFEYGHIKRILNGYCNLEGNSTEGYMECYFSPEWQDYGLEYFGDNKVLFDFHEPAVDEDKQIIISYQEFYEIVSKYYIEYANQHPEEKEEIMRLLKQLKKKLDVNDKIFE